MTRLAWVVPTLAMCCGCTQYQTRLSRLKQAPMQNCVPSSSRHDVANAVEAPGGDLQRQALRKKLEADPGNLEARLELASAYAKEGFPEIAIEHYRLAAERFPASEPVRIHLAKALRAEGLTAEAADGLEAWARGREHCSAAVYSWIGILRDELGQFAEGERAHREAIGRDARQDALRNNLGYNLLLQGRTEAAAGEFRAALELNRHSLVAANNLAAALSAGGSGKEAAAKLASATDAATAHNNLAAILMEQGRYPEARQELEAALKLNRNHPAALRNLALVGELDGKPAALPGKKKRQKAASREKTELAGAAARDKEKTQERP